MELIRQILLKTEALEFIDDDPYEPYFGETYNEVYQIALMKDAGLVVANIKTTGGIPSEARIIRLTSAGHDFLDSTRDSEIWKKAKELILKAGVSWTFKILVEWLKQEARKRVLGSAITSYDSIPQNTA
jgi:hypothetical protein